MIECQDPRPEPSVGCRTDADCEQTDPYCTGSCPEAGGECLVMCESEPPSVGCRSDADCEQDDLYCTGSCPEAGGDCSIVCEYPTRPALGVGAAEGEACTPWENGVLPCAGDMQCVALWDNENAVASDPVCFPAGMMFTSSHVEQHCQSDSDCAEVFECDDELDVPLCVANQREDMHLHDNLDGGDLASQTGQQPESRDSDAPGTCNFVELMGALEAAMADGSPAALAALAADDRYVSCAAVAQLIDEVEIGASCP